MIRDHFAELLLVFVLAGLIAFTVVMSHVHNDSLANKGTEFAGQVLAGILTVTVAAKRNPPVDAPPSTKEQV